MAKKRFAGGWEFDIWDETVAYAQGTVVSYGDYLYRAAMATSAGDNPLTAVGTFTFTDQTMTNTAPGDPMDTVNLDLPKWVLWDLGVDYYYGLLKGIAFGPYEIGAVGKSSTTGIRTLVVRDNFEGLATESSDEHTYDNATSASYEGYGFPAGMTSDWAGGIYAPSMVEFGGNMGGPESYTYIADSLSGLIYQPSTCLPVSSDDGPVGYWDNGGLATGYTIGGLFAISQTFGRDFNGGDFTTGTFSDSWTLNGGSGTYAAVTDTDPDYATDT